MFQSSLGNAFSEIWLRVFRIALKPGFLGTNAGRLARRRRRAARDVWHPAVDIYETEKEIVPEPNLPGVNLADSGYPRWRNNVDRSRRRPLRERK